MLIAEASQIRRGGGVLMFSFAVASILALVPLPVVAEPWRPAFLPLVVIYWSLTVPARVGVVAAWFSGLITDLLVGSLLGQHALALAIVAYLAVKLRQRLLVAPGWQRAGSVLLFLFIFQAILMWLSSLRGIAVPAMHYWSVPIASAIAWPTVSSVLRELRLRYRVN